MRPPRANPAKKSVTMQRVIAGLVLFALIGMAVIYSRGRKEETRKEESQTEEIEERFVQFGGGCHNEGVGKEKEKEMVLTSFFLSFFQGNFFED